MDRLDLNGSWKLAVIKHGEFLQMPHTPATCSEVYAIGTIDAAVPGNFELDMERAGLVPDPSYGLNVLELQQYEDRHLFYARDFAYGGAPDGTRAELVFEGFDTMGEVFLNGVPLGRADNMFIEWRFPLNAPVAGVNEIVVHIEPACIAARDAVYSAGNLAPAYCYPMLRLRKAPHTFGWNIMPRIVSAGLYRPVYIDHVPAAHIKQAYLMTLSIDAFKLGAELELFYEFETPDGDISHYTVDCEGVCGDSRFAFSGKPWFTAGKLRARLENARLWQPKGAGHPDLYSVAVSLKKDGITLDSKAFKHGIRTVSLKRCGIATIPDASEFHFEVNGRKTFILGANWVPADAFHSRDRERLPRIMELLDEVNCNMVRCWGGNVYEDDYFYDRCDELGILVWQDFSFACANYPFDPEFCEVVRREATAVIRRLRGHACLALWAGDNENDMFMPYGRDPNLNRISREVLPDVLLFEDPIRQYLPSSPYIDKEAWKTGDPWRVMNEGHVYNFVEYFKSAVYSKNQYKFISETGYTGCPSVESMRKFISPDKLWPWHDNEEWDLRSVSPDGSAGIYKRRIGFMAEGTRIMFGAIPGNLGDFALASQVFQAEAHKYLIEMFRVGMWGKTGIIWWNLIDGWPQFSSSIVDYYFGKKLSFQYTKQSQQPLLLAFAEPAGNKQRLALKAVNNSGRARDFSYAVCDAMTGETVLHGRNCIEDNVCLSLDSIPYTLYEQRFYQIEWECGDLSGRNHYLSGEPPFNLETYRGFLRRVYDDYI